MTQNEKMFLKLLSASVMGNNCEVLEDIDWNEIYEESLNQSVVSLIFESVHNLDGHNMPDSEFMLDWEEESMIAVMKNSAILYEHKALFNIMDNNNIKCCIIKGAAAAFNYSQPQLRTMGDIDLLVNKADFDKASEVLQNNGYVLQIDDTGIETHEIKFKKNGILVELHKTVPGVPDGKIKGKINSIIDTVVDNRETINLSNIKIYKPCCEHNGLILLLHIVHHLGSGIGIRQICDWSCYVKNELTEDIWNNSLEPIIRECKLLYFAKVLTKACCKYLKLPIECCNWCNEIDDNLCEEFIDYISESGNFGKKMEEREKSANLIIGNHTEINKNELLIIRVFKNLQSTGYGGWPLARKYKFVAIFAWTYVPVRFIKRLFTGERSIKELYTIFGSARKRYPLIKKLRIFRE